MVEMRLFGWSAESFSSLIHSYRRRSQSSGNGFGCQNVNEEYIVQSFDKIAGEGNLKISTKSIECSVKVLELLNKTEGKLSSKFFKKNTRSFHLLTK